MLSLLLGMSYNMPTMLSSKFQSPSIKIEGSKLTLLIFLTLAPRGGVKILSLLLGMSYNMPKLLSAKFQSPSIEIEKCLP